MLPYKVTPKSRFEKRTGDLKQFQNAHLTVQTKSNLLKFGKHFVLFKLNVNPKIIRKLFDIIITILFCIDNL